MKDIRELLIDSGIEESDFGPFGPIILQNDGDEYGTYIREWNSDKPIPDGFIVGKPNID